MKFKTRFLQSFPNKLTNIKTFIEAFCVRFSLLVLFSWLVYICFRRPYSPDFAMSRSTLSSTPNNPSAKGGPPPRNPRLQSPGFAGGGIYYVVVDDIPAKHTSHPLKSTCSHVQRSASMANLFLCVFLFHHFHQLQLTVDGRAIFIMNLNWTTLQIAVVS